MDRRLAGIFASLLFLSGCDLLTDCSFETRSVTASGRLVENGAELVRAETGVSAVRGSLRSKSFDYVVEGPPLQGHVLAITLIRAGEPGARLLDIPVRSLSTTVISTGGMTQREGEVTPALGGLYEILSANLGILELTTDLPSRSRILIPLTVTNKIDWYRPNNCY